MLTPEIIDQIAYLRSVRYAWREIGLLLGLKPETCRRALWAAKRARRAVGNSPATVNISPGGD